MSPKSNKALNAQNGAKNDDEPLSITDYLNDEILVNMDEYVVLYQDIYPQDNLPKFKIQEDMMSYSVGNTPVTLPVSKVYLMNDKDNVNHHVATFFADPSLLREKKGVDLAVDDAKRKAILFTEGANFTVDVFDNILNAIDNAPNSDSDVPDEFSVAPSVSVVIPRSDSGNSVLQRIILNRLMSELENLDGVEELLSYRAMRELLHPQELVFYPSDESVQSTPNGDDATLDDTEFENFENFEQSGDVDYFEVDETEEDVFSDSEEDVEWLENGEMARYKKLKGGVL